jgi:uncharacterized protein YqhQ
VPQGEYLQYGGQAIIEGVMMRSPRHFAVAVRAPNKEIVLHAEPLEKTWIGRQRWLKLPFLRGSLALLDAMALGYRALKFSTNVQLDPKYQSEPAEGEETPDAPDPEAAPRSGKGEEAFQKMAVGGALVGGLAIGLLLFNYLPNFLATLLRNIGVESMVAINFATEIIKIAFFLGYIGLIGLMHEIREVFKYHGAEHKAINTLEAEQELTLENCRRQTRLHPRCGTSFAIVVLIVGMITFTFMPKPHIPESRVLESIARFLVELPVLIPIAGLSYELIRWAGKMKNSALMRVLFAPGLATQYLTTREPDEHQIEVALLALQAVVEAEKAEESPKAPAEEVLEDVIS